MNTCIKFFALCAILLCNCLTIVGQSSIKLGSNPFTKNKNAAFEIESTNQGLMLPRLTTAQRDLIKDPTTGLMIWCTDCGGTSSVIANGTGQISIYNTSTNPPAWVSMSVASLSIPIVTSSSNPILKTPAVSTSAFSAIAIIENNGYNDNDFTTHINSNSNGNTGYGFCYNDFETLDKLPTTLDNVVLSSTVFSTTTQSGASFTSNFSSMLNNKSYYIRPFAKNPRGTGYGNGFVFSLAPPTFSTASTTILTSKESKVSVGINLLAGVAFNSATFSYGTTQAALDYTNQGITIPTFDNSTTPATVNLDVSIPVKNNTKIYVKFTATTNNSVITSSTSDYSFTPVVEATSGGSAVVTAITPGTAPIGFITGTAASKNWNFSITASTSGTFSISFVSNGLNFKGSGDLVAGESNTIPITITGTPLQYGLMAITTDLYSSVIPVATSNLEIGPTTSQAQVQYASICNGSRSTAVVPITSSTTKIWMDRNLGAFRKATSIADYSAMGCYFQWGRGNDGHASVITYTDSSISTGSATVGTTLLADASSSSFVSLISIDWLATLNNNLWQTSTVPTQNNINNPCPLFYRVPTSTELANEFSTYSPTNNFSSTVDTRVGLKFVAAGYRDRTGSYYNMGVSLFYWSSSSSSSYSLGEYVSVATSTPTSIGLNRIQGYSIRCIKN